MRKKTYNEITALQKRLRPLTPAQTRFAHSHYSKVAYCNSRNKEMWCQCCGHLEEKSPETLRIDLELSGRCPNCNAILNVEKKCGRHHHEAYYCTYGTHISGWQVFRTFLASRSNAKGYATLYTLNEVYQLWINENGEEHILSRRYTRSPLSGVKWDYSSPLSTPRQHNAICTGLYVMSDVFVLSGNYLYPRSTVTPVLRRNGFNTRFLLDSWLNPAEVCKALLTSSQLECVAKTQPKLFTWIIKNQVTTFNFHAVKICNRNGYTIDDPDIWLDYINNLEQFNCDTHNAHYVCPDDLVAAHERMMKRIMVLREKQNRERLKEKIRELESAYAKHIQPYIDIALHDGDLSITPLRTVAEIYEEGKHMHHCVFTNEYFRKKSSLLLTAKKDGERLETVELSLRSFDVLESRAKNNGVSPYHNRIISLINSNKQLFQQYERNQTTRP